MGRIRAQESNAPTEAIFRFAFASISTPPEKRFGGRKIATLGRNSALRLSGPYSALARNDDCCFGACLPQTA